MEYRTELFSQLFTLGIDSLRGVEVIEETKFEVSIEGGFFEWKGYGMKLSIPEDCLPTELLELWHWSRG